ncbi:MAG TPA: ATP synthase F1 subunit epsilon [Anaerolineales bacterium]|nr:ATP synthase F1 subunit epsilon [Anaerolineales bacterium]
MPIRCEIVSQDRTVFQGPADMVVLPGTDGEMGILPHHAPLLTTLKYGIIKVRSQGHEDFFTVAGGIAEIQPDIITILADSAENVEEIDILRAQAARKRAEESLAKGIPVDSDNYLLVEAALRRSNLRLEAARRYRRGTAKLPHIPDESR